MPWVGKEGPQSQPKEHCICNFKGKKKIDLITMRLEHYENLFFLK